MSSPKVVYLDFDGVLHPASPGADGLFSRAHLLDPLFEKSNAAIVISSSWRFTHSLTALQAKLPSNLAKSIVDVTGAPFVDKYARYQEIMLHAKKLDPGVQWCALDDSYWEFPSNCKELIRTNPNTGISDKELSLLSSWLLS